MSDEWGTPQALFDELHREFYFTLDPCASAANTKCKRYFTKVEDGLRQDWVRERVFMNPPFGEHGRDLPVWLEKAWRAKEKGAQVVALLPVRADLEWWHEYVLKADEIRWMKNRVYFVDEEGKHQRSPFPTCVVIWEPWRQVLWTGKVRVRSMAAMPEGWRSSGRGAVRVGKGSNGND